MNTLKIMDIIKDNIIKIINIQNVKINKYKIDSRNVEIDDVFIAIKGKKFDGNDYIDEAINNGCKLIITNKYLDIKEDIMIIIVHDTIEILGILAKEVLRKIKVPVIAVTGSNGKTITKELIANILSLKYKVLRSKGNYNNNIGLPLSILNYIDEDVIVLEMGMNHSGEIEKLSNICNPNIGVITNIGTAHIGNLGSKKNIYKAKLEILKGMNNGFLIINNDDKYLKKTKTINNKIIRCGSKSSDNIRIVETKYFLTKTKFKISYMNKLYDVLINVPGKYIMYDVLLAINVGIILNINIEDIIKVISEYKTDKNRINVIKKNNFIIINDCYNASYESLDNILSILENTIGDKLLILGDIYELGKYNRNVLKKIKNKINSISNCKILLMGTNMKKINSKIKNGTYCSDFETIFLKLKEIDLNDKIILIKASHAMNFDRIYNYLINVDKDK